MTKGYFCPEVVPRMRRLLLDPCLIISIIIGVVVAIGSDCNPKGYPILNLKSDDLAQMLISYASISFGASIAGMGFTLALPGEDRIRRWSSVRNHNSFTELVFVFSWAAVVQIGLILCSFLIMIFAADAKVGDHYWFFGAVSALTCYSVFELYSVVKAITQLARTISAEEYSKRSDPHNNQAATEQEVSKGSEDPTKAAKI